MKTFKTIGEFFKNALLKYDAFIRSKFTPEDEEKVDSGLTDDFRKDDKDLETPINIVLTTDDKDIEKPEPNFKYIIKEKQQDRRTIPVVKAENESPIDEQNGQEDKRKQKRMFQLHPQSLSGRMLGKSKSNDAFGNTANKDQNSLFKPRQRHRSFVINTALTAIMIIVILFAFIGVVGLGAVIGIINAYVDTTPVLDLAKIENLAETSFIYDDKGVLITTFSGLENRIYAPISEIPALLQGAFVATEDKRFYTHNGIDPKRIFGAFFNNIMTDTTQGGSTITTQLIKIRLLSYEQTYKRKLQEAYLALQLEQQYNKDQILEAYMNTIDLGSGNYGVKAAAEDYFGKELGELSLRECAMLAGVANSPYLYNPRLNFYKWKSPDLVNERTNLVLSRMYEAGYISKQEMEDAKADTVFVKENSPKQQMYDMPYFLEFAIVDVIEHMLRDRNMPITATNRSIIEAELRTEGYHIYTTVDREIQLIVEDTLYNWNSYPQMQYDSDTFTVSKNSDGTSKEVKQPQVSTTVFDYNTGQLKAIVGGRQDPTARKELNRAYQSFMPIGSSIKPIAVYGPAFNVGVSPANIVLDLPIPIPGWSTKKGYPSNYGGSFRGPVTVRKGLTSSINMVATRLLIDSVGVNDSYNTLINLGINPEHLNKDSAGLALGTSGITTNDMAVAYGAIGNNGYYIEPIAFTTVTDSSGQIILDSSKNRIERQVFTPAATWLLVDLLTNAVKSGTGRNAKITGMTVGGKTGTNSDYIGVFFTGLTPYYSAAVWVGHDNYKPLYRGATGGDDAAPLWQTFMEEIHRVKGLENDNILDTSPGELGLKKYTVCSVSGDLATEACYLDAAGHTPITDYFQEGHEPTKTCTQHAIFNVCNQTGSIATPYCPDVTQVSYIFIPQDSPVNELDDVDFLKYYTNAIRYVYSPASLSYDNPNHALLYYCTVHTLEWNTNKENLQNAIIVSNTLISRVKELMNLYSSSLSEGQAASINDAVSNLSNLIANSNDDQEILAAYDVLNTYKTLYLDPLIEDVGEG